MSISDDNSVGQDENTEEFKNIQFVNQDSQDKSTDPNIVKVVVIKPNPFACSFEVK